MVAKRGSVGVRRKARVEPERWTRGKRDIFLAELAQTANVSASARAAGMSERSPYSLRRRDPAFRSAWEDALDEGYAKLELLLLERATYGAVPPEGSALGEKIREVPTSLAMTLLKHRQSRTRERLAPPPRPMRGMSLKDELERRLMAIHRRLHGAD